MRKRPFSNDDLDPGVTSFTIHEERFFLDDEAFIMRH